MPTRPMSDSDAREAYDAVSRLKSVTLAANELGLSRSTVQDRFTASMRTFGLPDPRSTPAYGHQYTAYRPSEKIRSLEDIILHRRAESERAINYEDTSSLIRIDLKTSGPVGFMIVGDPHVDNPGCDFGLLESHLALAANRRDYIFAGNIGDVRDNWIGRLERMYADTTVSAKETWRLVEWMLKGSGVNWTWLVRGNHDAWAGLNDPLDWISKASGIGVDGDAGLRLGFHHPNGQVTRMHSRHDFGGSSIYNPLHGLKKEVLHGFRDHIIVAGHRHIGADARDVNGEGIPFVMLRVSGYKVSDSYRQTLGLKPKPLHPSALVIVDPDQPETSPARLFTAPCVEEGADYLDFRRDRFNSRPRIAPKKGKRA